jgi:isochorismate hydrolase
MMLNFKVAMVSDALATYSEEAHAASLLTFYGIFGDVLTIDEAIAGMGKAEAQRRRA